MCVCVCVCVSMYVCMYVFHNNGVHGRITLFKFNFVVC